MNPPESTKRDDLVRTAIDLFCSHGVHAVGIDRVIAEAGVAKATLYKHFPTKDDLVLAALNAKDADGRAALETGARAVRGSAVDRFAALASLVAASGSNGCLFVLVAQEFPEKRDPIHLAARRHKQRVRELLATLAEEAGASDPALVASKAQLVLDGLFAACSLGPADAKRAAAAAEDALRTLVS